MNKKVKKAIIIIAAALAVIIIACVVLFALVKSKKVLLNQIFISTGDVRGVDVSKYQMDIDMDALAAQGIKFIYIKATEGSSSVDEKFAENWKNAGLSNMARGAYHFFSFDSDGDTQARNYIETVGDLSGCLPPVIDFEFYGDKETNLPVKEDVERNLRILLEELEEEYGVKPIIYASGKAYDTYIEDDFGDYPRWVRSVYFHADLENGRSWTIWQYCDRGELSGYSGGEKYIDLNVLSRDHTLEELIIP